MESDGQGQEISQGGESKNTWVQWVGSDRRESCRRVNVAYSEYRHLRLPSIENKSEVTIDCTVSPDLIVLGSGDMFLKDDIREKIRDGYLR